MRRIAAATLATLLATDLSAQCDRTRFPQLTECVAITAQNGEHPFVKRHKYDGGAITTYQFRIDDGEGPIQHLSYIPEYGMSIGITSKGLGFGGVFKRVFTNGPVELTLRIEYLRMEDGEYVSAERLHGVYVLKLPFYQALEFKNEELPRILASAKGSADPVGHIKQVLEKWRCKDCTTDLGQEQAVYRSQIATAKHLME